MTQFLPPNLLVLFQARPPIQYMPPVEKPKLPQYSGIAHLLQSFEDPSTVDYSQFKPIETKDQQKERKRKERGEKEMESINTKLETWDPNKNPKATGDAYKTLFVGRVSYETTESKLKREFEEFGPVKKVRIVTDDATGKPRGYAFVEYGSERDMKNAYKYAEGKKIDGKRVLVDVERGRTVKGWRPRRFAGGLGSSRAEGQKPSTLGREAERAQDRGSDRGDRRESFGGDRRERERDGGDRRESHGGDRRERERDSGDRRESHGGDRRERDGGDRRESYGDRRERDGGDRRESHGGDRRERDSGRDSRDGRDGRDDRRDRERRR